MNWDLIGSGYVEEYNTIGNQNIPLTLQSTLKLKKGDQVWVAISWQSIETYLIDNSDHWTHFTGWMLEEEIAASLQ